MTYSGARGISRAWFPVWMNHFSFVYCLVVCCLILGFEGFMLIIREFRIWCGFRGTGMVWYGRERLGPENWWNLVVALTLALALGMG